MGNVLIRPYNNHASCFLIDAAHCKDVVAAPDAGAEHFLVVVKPVTPLPGQKQCGHGIDGKFTMSLLEHRANIDHRVDILPAARAFSDWRGRVLGEKGAQLADRGAWGGRI